MKNGGSLIALLVLGGFAYAYRAQLKQLFNVKPGTPTLGNRPGSPTVGTAAGTNPGGASAQSTMWQGFQPPPDSGSAPVTLETNPNSPSGSLGITGYD